jgi:hypothetical protein
MCIEDEVDTPDGVDLEGDVDMERDGEDEEDEEKEEEVVDKDEEKDEDEDDGKQHRTIAYGEMVNPSADDPDTMGDDQPTTLPEQAKEMRGHTPGPQPPATAPQPQTPEHRPGRHTPDIHTLSGLEYFGLVTLQKPRPAAPTPQEAEAAGNISHINVEQQLHREWAGGDSLPDVLLLEVGLPRVAFPDVPLHDVPLPHVPLPDVLLPEEKPDGSVGEE